MIITIKKEIKGKSNPVSIKEPNDWLKYAPPRGGEKQWKDGYSAKEFAKYVLNERKVFIQHIESVLNKTGADLISDFIGTPEATTDLGDGKRNGRKPDLQLVGEKSVISIEAKVNESFGSTVKSAKNYLRTKDERPNYLSQYLFGKHTPDNIDALRYQLLTATVGAIQSAKQEKKQYAYMLVINIKENVPQKETSNEKAFKQFCNALKINPGDYITNKGVKCWINMITVIKNANYSIKETSPLI